jgi:hypothetical protein
VSTYVLAELRLHRLFGGFPRNPIRKKPVLKGYIDDFSRTHWLLAKREDVLSNNKEFTSHVDQGFPHDRL